MDGDAVAHASELGRRSRAARGLLVAGLLLGAGTAALQIAMPGRDRALPPEAVARVGQRLILRDEWLRAVAAVSSERRTPLTAADRRAVLERLVDEQLLVQRGLDLGLAEHDQRVRGDLVQAVMFAAMAAPDAPPPDDAALEAFLRAHPERFTSAPRLRLAAWRLDAAGQALPFVPPIPGAALPPAKLEAYIGPAAVQAALALAPGASTTLDVQGQPTRLQLLAREDAPAPTLAAVHDQVRAEYRRDADEAAVRALLQQLRRDYRVELAPSLP